MAANVKVRVRKQRSHFAEHAVQYLIGLFQRGINGWTNVIGHSAHQVCWRRRGCDIGMSDQPAYRAAPQVKTREHNDATFPALPRQLPELFLQVESPLGGHSL